MDHGMLAKQNHFARCTDEPLAVFPRPLPIRRRLSERELLHRFVDSVGNTYEVVGGHSDSTGFEKGVTEIIQEVSRVFDANTQTDEVFRKSTSSPSRWVDGSVTIPLIGQASRG